MARAISPLKIVLSREAALRAGCSGRKRLQGRLAYRHQRGSGRFERARCGRPALERIHGQHSGADRFGHPLSAGRIEGPAAPKTAEPLRLAAVAARRETLVAPQANVAMRLGRQKGKASAASFFPVRRPAGWQRRSSNPKHRTAGDISACGRVCNSRWDRRPALHRYRRSLQTSRIGGVVLRPLPRAQPRRRHRSWRLLVHDPCPPRRSPRGFASSDVGRTHDVIAPLRRRASPLSSSSPMGQWGAGFQADCRSSAPHAQAICGAPVPLNFV
jgi:hypothetical protein